MVSALQTCADTGRTEADCADQVRRDMSSHDKSLAACRELLAADATALAACSDFCATRPESAAEMQCASEFVSHHREAQQAAFAGRNLSVSLGMLGALAALAVVIFWKKTRSP